MNVLFLDDNLRRWSKFRSCVPYAKHVETAVDCIAKLREGDWDVLFLDHDLGGLEFVDPSEPETGSEVVRWLVANPTKIDRIIVHTHNHLCGPEMVQALKNKQYQAVHYPFNLAISELNESEFVTWLDLIGN